MNELDRPNVCKALAVSIAAFFTIKLDALAGWLQIYVAAILLDYLTGIVSAAYLQELSSRIGLRGIIRKVAGWIVVAVALLADEVISRAALAGGYSVSGVLSTAVVIWLIVNELISILENISKTGVPLPSFLPRILLLVKKQVQKQGESIDPSHKQDSNL